MTKKQMIETLETIEALCKPLYWETTEHHKLSVKVHFAIKRIKLVKKAEAVEEFNKIAVLAQELLA